VSERVEAFSFRATQPQRLDHFLVECMPEHSRARLQKLIKGGMVFVKGEPVRKTGYQLEGQAMVEVHIPPVESTELEPEEIPLEIIFENDDVVVVNKGAGMVVHPSAGHSHGTLAHAILAHAPDIEGIGGELRPGIVHRLDKDTSGLLVVAKNDRSMRYLQKQFRHRQVEKVYLALVDGTPPTPEGRVEAPIGRDSANRKKMAVVPEGKGREAVSEYHLLERFPKHSYLEVHPVSGRTHQIRVHMAFLGCPVAGDRIYGRRKPSLPLKRHFLHAARLTIRLPGATRPRRFEAPLPEELAVVLEDLRAASSR
jgi:23S rRNA pseudouridine1911/1915/1917 synthase